MNATVLEVCNIAGRELGASHLANGGDLQNGCLASRVLCQRAGLLADIAAGDRRIHAKLFITARG